MNPFSNLGASTRMPKPAPKSVSKPSPDKHDTFEEDDDDHAAAVHHHHHHHVEELPTSDGVPQDAHCVDPKSGLAALLQVVANTCESRDRENVNRRAQVDVHDSAESYNHRQQQQQQQQFADVTNATTPINGPLHLEATGALKHCDDEKIAHGDGHSNFCANEGLKVRIDPKTSSRSGLPTTSTEPATVTPDGLLPNAKEHSDDSDTKLSDQRQRNAVTKSENTTEIRVDAESLEFSNRPVAVAASLKSNRTQPHERDVIDSTTSTHQQRTAPSREPISSATGSGGPTTNNDYNAIISSEIRRTTNNPGGDLSQYYRGEILPPAFNFSRGESEAHHGLLLPSRIVSVHAEQQQEEEKVSSGNVNLNAQFPRPQAAPSNAEVEEVDDDESIDVVAQHQDPARSAAPNESDDGLEPEIMVPEPRPTDILLGRGPACYGHQGNQRFRLLIHRHRHLYRNHAPRREKAMLVHGLVSLILQDGGRFLQERSGMWYEVSPQIARKKVGHALRDARLRQQELDQHRVAESRRRSSHNNNNNLGGNV